VSLVVRRRATGLWVLLAGLCAVGCFSFLRNPQLEDRARVTALSLAFPEPGRGLLTVTLNARSPSAQPMPLVQLEWELWLEGRHFASGVRALEGAVLPEAQTELHLEAPLAFRVLPTEPKAARRAVALRGFVAVGEREEPLRLPFTHHETLEVTGAPVLPALGGEDEG
jgi:hypothetical protein